MSKKLLQAAAGAGGEALYVEDVFSTYLYTGNGSTQTITNGIDLDGEGGLVWIKQRDDANPHVLFDTERGTLNTLHSNQTSAAEDEANSLTSYNSNGFTLGSFAQTNGTSSNGLYASWTFRKAEKFFDVVTYTGTGSVQNIAHNLGSQPACVIVKRTDGTQNWWVYHKSLDAASPENYYITLNLTDARTASGILWNSTQPTDSVFTVDSSANVSGATYVAYLFASDAGGFGDDGSESIIKCGSFAGVNSPSNVTVNLGWEPQWVLVKVASGDTNSWLLFDNMRGVPTGITDAFLKPDSSNAEGTSTTLNYIDFNATGFTVTGDFQGMASGRTFIYIAIRRPMKTPESGTEVFAVDTAGATAPSPPLWTSGFITDFALHRTVNTLNSTRAVSRLTGEKEMFTNSANAEGTDVDLHWDYMNGFWDGSTVNSNQYSWMFKRATGFFDVVAYTGSSGAKDHSLAVTPELMIIKDRNPGPDPRGYWNVYHKDLGTTHAVFLNSTQASTSVTDGTGLWNNTSPTDSFFYTGYTNAGYQTGSLGQPYIAYLFATLAGVSKVGSYTGTGSNVDVDCGFSAGARFILIKRTDSTGDWYVYDSVRGIVAGNDPYLLLNSTAAEVTSTDYIDPLSSGFTVTSSAPAALNASGGTFIYLAIA